MDTSSKCTAYFGDSKTVIMTTGSGIHTLTARGKTFTTFRIDSGLGIVRLPDVDLVPQGTRLLVANLPASVANLVVSNGGTTFAQSAALLAGQMAEFSLIAAETTFGSDQTHQGSGQSSLWTGAGYWVWDIFAHTRKGALG